MTALTMRDHQLAYDRQSPPEDAEEVSDLIRDALDSGDHNVWLSHAIADAINDDDAIDLLRTIKRHLVDVLRRDAELLAEPEMEQ